MTALLLLGSLLLFPFSAQAAPTPSALTGRVTSAGQPAAGVTVTLASNVLLQPLSTLTGAQGTYWFTALPPGDYEVTFARPGLTTLTRRAIVELARVARADAALEPTEDDETVTSTARTAGEVDTAAVTTHFSDSGIERLPVDRHPLAVALIGPLGASFPATTTLDGVELVTPTLLAEEIIEQVTFIRAGVPAENDLSARSLITAITRSGGEEFSLTLRDTISSSAWISGPGEDDGLLHFFEVATGGRIASQKLRFFVSAWGGDSATRTVRDAQGALVKLTAQLLPAHHIQAELLDAEAEDGLRNPGQRLSLLRHTGTYGAHTTTVTTAQRSEVSNEGRGSSSTDEVSTRITRVLPFGGDHVVSAGGAFRDDPFGNSTALHLSDRWSAARWTFSGGLRYDQTDDGSELSGRVAAILELPGSERNALVATFGEYAEPHRATATSRITSLGYVVALGTSGVARIDLLRRDEPASDPIHEVLADAHYNLFGRFEVGGNYSYFEGNGMAAGQQAAGWISVDLPFGDKTFGVTLLERWTDAHTVGSIDLSSDLALRYAIPFPRWGLTLASDVTNLFDRGEGVVQPRAIRFWLRARL